MFILFIKINTFMFDILLLFILLIYTLIINYFSIFFIACVN